MEAATAERPKTDAAKPTGRAPEPPATHGGSPAHDGELVVDVGGQLSFSVGGKKPTGSSLRLTGGKFKVTGDIAKGDRLVVEIRSASGKVLFEGGAVVNEVAFKDETDSKTGQVVGSERRHKAAISA